MFLVFFLGFVIGFVIRHKIMQLEIVPVCPLGLVVAAEESKKQYEMLAAYYAKIILDIESSKKAMVR